MGEHVQMSDVECCEIRLETCVLAEHAEDMLRDVANESDLRVLYSVPIAELAALGSGIASLVPALRTATISSTANVQGLYQLANAEVGATLKAAKDGTFWGAMKCPDGTSKMAKLKEADIQTLVGMIRKYKYNWDNEQYLKSSHKLVLDLQRTARKNMLFYQKSVRDPESQTAFCGAGKDKIHTGRSPEEISVLQAFFVYVQSGGKSAEGCRRCRKRRGKVYRKHSEIKDGPVDEFLQDQGDRLKSSGIDMERNALKEFAQMSNPETGLFTEKMEDMIRIYDQTTGICFDNENIYLMAV